MTIHFTLQGKGGVGKTLVSNLLAQHQISKKTKLVCIDTDPGRGGWLTCLNVETGKYWQTNMAGETKTGYGVIQS